jgi:formylglycine-generating enzyme required for sulfatase activity
MQSRTHVEYWTTPRFDRAEKPVHEVYLSTFQISRYPVTVSEYQRFVEEDGYQDPRWWKAGGFAMWAEPKDWPDQFAFPNRPVVGVSWFEAAAYCAWAGNRLPTEAEWERAARGVAGRIFPWGNEPADPSRLNFETTRLGKPSPVGVFLLGATPEGVHDLAGNVWEWVADWAGAYARKATSNPHGPGAGTLKVHRGGCWSAGANACRAAFRAKASPTSRGPILGFRAVKSRADRSGGRPEST